MEIKKLTYRSSLLGVSTPSDFKVACNFLSNCFFPDVDDVFCLSRVLNGHR